MDKVRSADTRFGITTGSADTRRGQDFSRETGLASVDAQRDTDTKQQDRLVWGSAMEVAKTIPEYIEAMAKNDTATANKILQGVLAEMQGQYKTMAGGAGAQGGKPWEQNYGR
jgi:hypothetical protein